MKLLSYYKLVVTTAQFTMYVVEYNELEINTWK